MNDTISTEQLSTFNDSYVPFINRKKKKIHINLTLSQCVTTIALQLQIIHCPQSMYMVFRP